MTTQMFKFQTPMERNNKSHYSQRSATRRALSGVVSFNSSSCTENREVSHRFSSLTEKISMFEQTEQEIASENEPDVSMMKMLVRRGQT